MIIITYHHDRRCRKTASSIPPLEPKPRIIISPSRTSSPPSMPGEMIMIIMVMIMIMMLNFDDHVDAGDDLSISFASRVESPKDEAEAALRQLPVRFVIIIIIIIFVIIIIIFVIVIIIFVIVIIIIIIFIVVVTTEMENVSFSLSFLSIISVQYIHFLPV